MDDDERRGFHLVSVVIPCYNAAGTIEAQLAALAGQTYGDRWEVVISDNGSTDSTREVVQRWAGRLPRLRVVDSSAERGPAYARNLGAVAAEGDLVAYCDADDVADSRWLAELVLAAGGADVVGGALENSMLNEPSVLAWRGDFGAAGLDRPLGFLPFVVSANCAVRRSTLSRLGGWREDYAYCEDVEFSWRAQLAGCRVAFAQAAIMHYRHRDSATRLARQVYNFAAAEPRLYRDFRGRGARRRPARQILVSWSYTVTRLPYLALSRRRRGFWLVVSAANWGRLVGSARYRVFCL
jgi:glycosyltransferase involved in cell wall biosynthesis